MGGAAGPRGTSASPEDNVTRASVEVTPADVGGDDSVFRLHEVLSHHRQAAERADGTN